MSSKYLEIEDCVRKTLSEKIGKGLSKKTAVLFNGTTREFDGLTEDREIVVEIKASSIPAKGKIRHTQLAEMSEACLFMLALNETKRRILAISNKDFYSAFVMSSQAEAALILGIEILHVPCD